MNVFPTLAGIKWPVVRRPMMNTRGQEINRRFVGVSLWKYPQYEFDLDFEFLTPSDFDQLVGLFLESYGNVSPFWFDAGDGDDAVVKQAIGAGDGTTTTFTLLRATGSFTQPVDGSFGTRQAFVDDVATAATFTDTTVTFSAAPGAGTAISWSGSYYYKCRFKQSNLELQEFLYELHSNKLTLRTTR